MRLRLLLPSTMVMTLPFSMPLRAVMKTPRPSIGDARMTSWFLCRGLNFVLQVWHLASRSHAFHSPASQIDGTTTAWRGLKLWDSRLCRCSARWTCSHFLPSFSFCAFSRHCRSRLLIAAMIDSARTNFVPLSSPDFARLPDLPEQILHVYEADIGLFSLHSFRVYIDLPTFLHSEYRKI
jgi:hypothetical protein